jgi:hypothetical protein
MPTGQFDTLSFMEPQAILPGTVHQPTRSTGIFPPELPI